MQAANLVVSYLGFWSLYLTKCALSQLKLHGKDPRAAKIDAILCFCSQFEPFFNKRLQACLRRSPFENAINRFWTFPKICQQIISKSTYNFQQNVKMLKFFDFSTRLESFWSLFKLKRCNIVSKKTYFIASPFTVEHFGPCNIRDFSEMAEMVHKLHDKQTKTECLGFLDKLRVNLKHFSLTNCIYLLTVAY